MMELAFVTFLLNIIRNWADSYLIQLKINLSIRSLEGIKIPLLVQLRENL